MSKVVVTGAAGFVGRHLLEELRTTGHEVIALDRHSGDVTEESTWTRLPGADMVVHLAAKSFVPASWDDPVGCLSTNVLGTMRALEFAKRHQARVIYLSSYMYGTPASLPIPETAEVRASNPYALSKRMGEEACQFVANTGGVRVVILRPFNVYGPGQGDGFLIPRIVRQVQAGEAIRVNDLEPKRDFVHVRDLTRAIMRAMEFPGDFAVFNIGSGTSHSVAELIHLVQSEWRTNLPVISEGVRRPGEIMDTVADISMARRQLGWRPDISLQQGLAEMHHDLVSESARA